MRKTPLHKMRSLGKVAYKNVHKGTQGAILGEN